MKRIIAILLFLSMLSVLSAADSSDTRTSNINEGNTLIIRGFYEANDENIIQFMITEAESGAQVLHAGVITTTQDAGAPADIFDWVLKGNYNGTEFIRKVFFVDAEFGKVDMDKFMGAYDFNVEDVK